MSIVKRFKVFAGSWEYSKVAITTLASHLGSIERKESFTIIPFSVCKETKIPDLNMFPLLSVKTE